MTWTNITFEPGVWKDDSPLKAQGTYIDADKIRFVNGLPETIYGWERASASALLGLCRGLFTWQDNARSAYAALGTHLRLYVMDQDGTVTDLTPATGYDQQSISFATAGGAAVVTVTGWTHGLAIDQKFKFENATVAAIGGVTVNGTYTVLTVESATSLTFTAAQTAASSAGPTAVRVDITAYLAPGQADGLGGLGFGTGGYGSGGYGGGASSYALYPRTWAFDQWGQNLLGSPRGDGLYEWAPHVNASELVTNGSFSSAAGWSVGSGWSVGGGFAAGSAGASSRLDQNIVLQPGAWHLLTLNLTVGAGALAAIAGGATIGASITATGNYRRAFYAGGGAAQLQLQKDSAFTGTLHDVSIAVLTTARQVPNAPTQIGSMFVTAERIVVACGTNLDGAFDALQVDWSDAEDHQAWTPTSANLAGGYTLPAGGRIVRGLRGARENVIWTTDAVWSMRFNGNPNSVYDFTEMGRGCGLIGPNAAAQIAGVWYWMTPTGAFYAYGGAQPQLLSCTLARDVRDHLAWVQQDKIYASRVTGKNYAEVWWFYPDLRDGNECSRYVIYDTIRGTWSCGRFDRSAYDDGAVFEHPLAADTNGGVWFHEKGFTQDGGARAWFVTSAFNAQAGGQLAINGVRPDADDLQGGYAIAFTSKVRSVKGAAERSYPALGVTASTGERSVRVKGEQVGFTISGNAAPSYWRQGALAMDIFVNSSRR
ncbi:MAG: hypothetical protein AB7I36_03735 [Rhodospirillaceae bacterium]